MPDTRSTSKRSDHATVHQQAGVSPTLIDALDEREILWRTLDKTDSQLRRLAKSDPASVFGQQFSEAFGTLPGVVACMDDRIPAFGHNNRARIGLAGSGILLDQKSYKRFIDRIRAYVARYDVNDLCTCAHAECGGAALYCQQNKANGGPTDPETAAMAYIRRLHDELKLEDRPLYAGYGPKATVPMKPMSQFHPARVITLDGSGLVDLEAILPYSFQISTWWADNLEYSAVELGVALSIVLGHYGFGLGRFTGDNRLRILIIGHPSNRTQSVESIYDACEKILKTHRDHVDVVSFTAPTGLIV